MDGEKRPPPERRLSAPDIRVVAAGDPNAHDLYPAAEKRAHSADNSPTLPLRILPPPIYTRTSQHQHPAPPPPQIPSPPKAAEAHHSPEHAAGQDQPLPPSPETRPLSEVAEERVAQWVDQEAAARASLHAPASTSQQVARSGATQQAVGESTTLAQQRRAVVGQSYIGSAGASQDTGRSVALIASNVTVDELADRLLQRIALALPSYHSQAGSSEQNLDPRLNPSAPVPNSDPPSSYRSHTVRQAATTATSQDRPTTISRDQTASRSSRTHLTVPARHGSRSDHTVGTAPQASTPVGTEGSQLTATGWLDAFHQFPDPPPSSQLSLRRRSAQPAVPAQHVNNRISPTDTRQDATALQHLPALLPPQPNVHQHVSTNTPPVSSMLANAGITSPARPPPAPEQPNRHFTRKVSTTPPKLEPEPQPRRLTVQLREHVRAHPETGLIVTPDPSDELGLPFEAGPELAQLMRQPNARPMKDACTQTSPWTSRKVQSKQAATVETVYSGSEKWPTPPKGAEQAAGNATSGKRSDAVDTGRSEQREQSQKAGIERAADKRTGESVQAGIGRNGGGRKEQHIRFTDTSRDAGPEPDRRSARDVTDSKGSKADLPQVEATGQEPQKAQTKSESQISLPNPHADTKEVHGHTKSQQKPRTLLSKAKEYWNAITEEDRKSIVTDWSGSVDSNENGGRRDVCRWPTELPPMVRCHGTTRCLEHNWTEKPGELITTNRMRTGQMDKDERNMRARLLDRSQPGNQQPDRDQQQRRRPEQVERRTNDADKKWSGADQRSSTKRANDNKKERKGSDSDVIEIPRSRSPDQREQRPRVVSYTYVGRPDLDHRDLHRPSNHRRDDDIPRGESYRRTSTIVRKGRSGDTAWRFEEREADACDNRVRYGTAPAPASKSKTRTVVTEHTDVFGQIVRQERSTTVSSSTRPREQRKRSAPRHSLPVEFDFSSSSDSDVPPAFAHRGSRAPHATSREVPMSMPMMPLGMVPPQMIMQFGLPMAWSRSKGSWYT